MHEQLDELAAFAAAVVADGIRHVVLLGMGGSSLAPEVFQRTFGHAAGYPELLVLDSTHPAAVRAIEARIGLRDTLFVVSSKSGTTTETLSLFRYFWHRVGAVTDAPGRHVVAITDPGTPLERLARERGFRRTCLAPPDVGGRYAALTVFGLVPAALIGMDVHRLLDRVWTMAEACAFCIPAPVNACLALGAALGELALAGRNKVTFLASRSLAALPDWIEQLIAESTGKDGRGIVPVVGEPLGTLDVYGADRVFALLLLEQDDDCGELDGCIGRLQEHGHPVVSIRLSEKTDLGQEFFRWEVAVAAAGAVLGIHPFNQPDVELAKELARQVMAQQDPASARAAGMEKHTLAGEEGDTVPAADTGALVRALRGWTAEARTGDYVALQAYLAPAPETTAALRRLQVTLRDRLRVATTRGYGPRFLHSTGQLHKGGPNTGLFLQLVDDPGDDLPIPETTDTFGALIRAQALGDYLALRRRGRRVLRVDLGRDVPGGLARIAEALHA
ncbi:MAG: hypothetical protein HY660_12100 [Armatimonadetes bacterium]|nr:hypothetical protein [Armatimonadota bacterium]